MVARLIVVVGLVACVGWAARMSVPPGPVAAKGLGDFSIDNALGHVRAMAAEGPHPAGTEPNARVRGYLMDQLTKLGMEPRVLSGVAFARREGRERAVQNIVARLPGSDGGGPAVMLAAHYDSVPHGPGAGDDGAAVGALLETCRAIKAGPPLRRDVLLLLSDGEEYGLIGARALFASDAKILRQAVPDPRGGIGVALNFDARGTAGPSLMFETAAGNARIIREFAAADPYPYANSLSYDVYKMLSNDTDFTVFKRPVDQGGGELQGLNFAFISNYFWYHSPGDTPENLSAASAFHHGSHAVAMARRFGGMSAAELRAIKDPGGPDAVYFNVSRGTLVSYPAGWRWPLVIVQGVLAACAIVMGMWRGVMTGRGFLGGAARLVLALVVAPAAVYGLMLAMSEPQRPHAFYLELLAVAVVAAVVTVTFALTPARFRRGEAEAVRGRRVASFAGVVLVFLAGLSVASARYVPGGSFLVVWPGIGLALGMIVGVLGAKRIEVDGEEELVVEGDPGRRSAPAWVGVVVVAVLATAVVLWGPLLVQLFTALTLGMAWACSIGVVVAMVIVVAAFTPLAIAGGGTVGRPGATRIDPA